MSSTQDCAEHWITRNTWPHFPKALGLGRSAGGESAASVREVSPPMWFKRLLRPRGFWGFRCQSWGYHEQSSNTRMGNTWQTTPCGWQDLYFLNVSLNPPLPQVSQRPSNSKPNILFGDQVNPKIAVFHLLLPYHCNFDIKAYKNSKPFQGSFWSQISCENSGRGGC